MTFDYVCARRNEIDPKGPCHIYIYMFIRTRIYNHPATTEACLQAIALSASGDPTAWLQPKARFLEKTVDQKGVILPSGKLT